jgi:hypothetical protein
LQLAFGASVEIPVRLDDREDGGRGDRNEGRKRKRREELARDAVAEQFPI